MPNFHEWLASTHINESTNTVTKAIRDFFSRIDYIDDYIDPSIGFDNIDFKLVDSGIEIYVSGRDQNSIWLINGERIKPYVRIDVDLIVNTKPVDDDLETLLSYGLIEINDFIKSADLYYSHMIYDIDNVLGSQDNELYSYSGIITINFSDLAPNGITGDPDLSEVNSLIKDLWDDVSAFDEAERNANSLLPDDDDEEY